MQDCLFCKIMAGEIPSKKVYEDEDTYAFYDIAPAGAGTCAGGEQAAYAGRGA